MRQGILAVIGVLTLACAPAAWAQPSTPSQDQPRPAGEPGTQDVTGRVDRIDPQANVIVLESGRMYRVNPNTVVYIDNQPVTTVRSVQPGQTVVIRSGEAVTYQGGQYIVVQPSGAPTSVVVATPGAAAALRQTIYGSVVDVDRAEIKIKIDGGDFEIKVAPEVARQIRKGDNVQLDVTVLPNPPSALPRTR